MDEFASNAYELPLLQAICETDLTAWCYLPLANRDVSYCSNAFIRLWNIDEDMRDNPSRGSFSESSFAEALTAQGIEARSFFAMVAERAASGSPPILLVRKDAVKINAEVTVVSSDLHVVGHLIRYREVVERNVIDALLREISDAQRRLKILSSREREILNGICNGHTNKSISISADISEKTVEKHRARIMQKLNLKNSAELFRLTSKATILAKLDQCSELDGRSVPIRDSADTASIAMDYLR